MCRPWKLVLVGAGVARRCDGTEVRKTEQNPITLRRCGRSFYNTTRCTTAPLLEEFGLAQAKQMKTLTELKITAIILQIANIFCNLLCEIGKK